MSVRYQLLSRGGKGRAGGPVGVGARYVGRKYRVDRGGPIEGGERGNLEHESHRAVGIAVPQLGDRLELRLVAAHQVIRVGQVDPIGRPGAHRDRVRIFSFERAYRLVRPVHRHRLKRQVVARARVGRHDAGAA